MLLNPITPCVFVSFMYWLNRYEPETMKKARRAMLVKDYIRYMISGEFGSDYSDAASTIIFDQVKREWAWRIMDDLRFNKELFPKEVHYASDIAGTVSKVCSAETGLRAGTPVCFGGGDTLMNHMLWTTVWLAQMARRMSFAASLRAGGLIASFLPLARPYNRSSA